MLKWRKNHTKTRARSLDICSKPAVEQSSDDILDDEETPLPTRSMSFSVAMINFQDTEKGMYDEEEEFIVAAPGKQQFHFKRTESTSSRDTVSSTSSQKQHIYEEIGKHLYQELDTLSIADSGISCDDSFDNAPYQKLNRTKINDELSQISEEFSHQKDTESNKKEALVLDSRLPNYEEFMLEKQKLSSKVVDLNRYSSYSDNDEENYLHLE